VFRLLCLGPEGKILVLEQRFLTQEFGLLPNQKPII